MTTENQAPEGGLQSAVQRALSAWDTTVLPRANDGMMQEAMELLRAEFDASMAGQSEPEQTWAGAGAFITTVENAAGRPDAGRWADEFLAWYQPEKWLGEHRAAAVFLGGKLAVQAPAEGDALTDEQAIELASALEVHRALRIVADVAALPIGGADVDMPTPLHAGYQLACEEIAERIRTEVHVLPGGLTLPGCGPLPSVRQPADAPNVQPKGMLTDEQIDAIVDRHFRHKNHPDSYSALRATIKDALASQPKGAQCDHHESLTLKSAETGEPLYCEACDDKSGRRDAEERETAYAVEIGRLRNVIQAACIGGTDLMIERWKQWFPDAPVPTVKAVQAPAPAHGEPAAWIRWEWNRSGRKSLVFEKPAELSLAEEATGVVYDPLFAAQP